MTTFYDLIFTNKEGWNQALLITNENQYSLHDLNLKVENFINLLQAEGDLRGKKIAALIPNLPIYFSLLIAVNKLGGTFIPLSHQYRSEDLTNVLNLTKPHIIFTVKELNGIPFKQMICKWSNTNSIQATLFTYDGLFEKECLRGNQQPLETEAIDLIACTSGSTGVPKGIKLNVDALNQWTQEAAAVLQIEETDRIFLTIPATAPYGICWLLTCFHNRIPMVIPENFDMPIVIKLLTEHPCNKMATSPSIYKGIYLFMKSFNPAILSQIDICGLAGEPITSDFINLTSELTECRFTNSYGLSEQGILMNFYDIKDESGRWSVSKGIAYKVVDPSIAGIGELAFKTAHGFSGYYKNGPLTEEVLTTEGWFLTGDLVQVDEHHKINIVGRKKEMIKKGGIQVIPGEIEQILNQHPLVGQSAVVGIPHDVYGEEIVAFIVCKVELETSALFNYMRERIAGYKVPGEILKINKMPIIQGKLDKVSLKSMAIHDKMRVLK